MNTCKCLFTPLLSVPPGVCPEVEVLDRLVILCLIFFFEKLLTIFKITPVTKCIRLLLNLSMWVSSSQLKVRMSKTKLPMPPAFPPP